MPVGLSADGGNGVATAEGCGGALGFQPSWVVAGRQQQSGGDFRANCLDGHEVGRDGLGDAPQSSGDILELLLEVQLALGKLSQGQPCYGRQGVVVRADPERRADRGQLAARQGGEPGSELLGGGYEQLVDLVPRLGAGLASAALQCFQRAECLDRTVVALGPAGLLTGLDSAGRAARAHDVQPAPLRCRQTCSHALSTLSRSAEGPVGRNVRCL